MKFALGQWISKLANQRVDQYGETPQAALTWVQEWVDIRAGAYRALGAPYGDDDDDLLRWLEERNPLAAAAAPAAMPERTAPPAPDAHT